MSIRFLHSINAGDVLVGALFVATGFMFLQQYRKQSPQKKVLKLISLGMIILGLTLIVWEPVNSLITR